MRESVPDSYFMACGFRSGYFGMQERGGGKPKVVLFSVWDPGKQNTPGAVPADQRVEVLYHAEDVEVRRFGGEGTGGQSFFNYDWKIGQTYRFLVRSKVEGERTEFAGYFFLPETGEWKHLVTFRTITGGKSLSGYYSFIEDFRRDGRSVHERRSAQFGNGWVRDAAGRWSQLVKAQFTGDRTPLDNVDASVDGPGFVLATGGQTVKHVELQAVLQRTATQAGPPPLPPE